MITDKQSNPMTDATTAAAVKYDEALHAFNLYRGDPVTLIETAIELAPRFTMAHVLKAWLYLLSTEPVASKEAAGIVARGKSLRTNERETSHLSALEKVLKGDWTAAAVAMDYHNARFPHDLLALQAGHLMDFYRANARDLRDRIARVLPQWSASLPGYPVVLGLYAFGLEETGDYGRAEATGRQAVELEPFDCWAHHAVAHVMEMQGRAEDGLGWMVAREPYWAGEDNLFKVHIWWHRALYHLELGQHEEVLRLYDGPIRGERSAVALDMIDASALLWRLQLVGRDVGERWRELALCWDRHADARLYAFNDWHAVMAYLGAGREAEIDRLTKELAENSGDSDNAVWARTVGLPLIEGFIAFWRGEYEQTVTRLQPLRYAGNGFGGSHAQRDIIDWTLVEAALRGGMRELAQALAQERLALKPHSPINRDFLRRAVEHG